MRDQAIKRLALGGVLAAVIVLLTTLVSVPMPGGFGYINLGDMGVLLAGALLGGFWGALCAGAASALSDVLLGYAVYAPATFVIKGLTALLAGVLIGGRESKLRKLYFYPCAMIVPIGYFLYECMLYGQAAALPNVAFNALQGLIGAVCAHAFNLLMRSKL